VPRRCFAAIASPLIMSLLRRGTSAPYRKNEFPRQFLTGREKRVVAPAPNAAPP
jgi:hypothetical protein